LFNILLGELSNMRKSLLLTAVLGALYMPSVSFAAEEAEAAPAAAAPVSPWTVTTNIGFVSDYYARGISQNWHKPAVQGGFDVAHSSGFFAGVWGSNVSPNTFPDASVELDLYGGYNGTISAVEGLGYSVGAIGYFYPGGSWKKYNFQGTPDQTPDGGRWNTYEANASLSYKWISAKASVTLGDWFGAESDTGWDGGTSGTTYVELNAAYPLPWYGLTLVGHVGHLNVAGKLDLNVPSSANSLNEDDPDYTDYKIGLSKSFKIANSEGWNAGVYYVGASDTGYWSGRGFGGASFNGSFEVKDLSDNRWVVSVSRVF
jgi:uncharacterized protein (TIGR02001 family)